MGFCYYTVSHECEKVFLINWQQSKQWVIQETVGPKLLNWNWVWVIYLQNQYIWNNKYPIKWYWYHIIHIICSFLSLWSGRSINIWKRWKKHYTDTTQSTICSCLPSWCCSFFSHSCAPSELAPTATSNITGTSAKSHRSTKASVSLGVFWASVVL